MATSTPDVWKKRMDVWAAKYKEDGESAHDEARRYYRNRFPPGLVSVNLVFSFGRAMVPQLYFKNPSVTVRIKGENAPNSRLLQEADVELIKQMRLKYTLKKMIVSAYLTGRGVGKLGWDAGDGATTPFDPAAMIKPRQPWFLHVLTKNWAHDIAPNGDTDDLRWAGMRVSLTRSQLEAHTNLTDHAREEMGKLADDDPDDTLDLWEVWDRGAGEQGLLLDDKWAVPPAPFSVWPFYGLEFNWTPEEPIPTSDAELISHLQKEYNENETQIHEHRRISVLRMLARKGALKQEERDKLERGVVGTVAEVDVSGPIGEAILPFAPEIPSGLFEAKKTLMEDVRDVIGFTRNQIGEFNQSRRTAQEAAIVQAALQIRLDERRDMVADVIEHVIRGANQLIFKGWDAADAKRYAGVEDGWEQLAAMEKDDYTVTIVPDSTLPLTKSIQRQQGLELYNALKGDPLTDQLELRKMFLGSYEGVDPEKLINREAAAILQQMGGDPTAMIQGAQGNQGRTGVSQSNGPRPGGGRVPQRTGAR